MADIEYEVVERVATITLNRPERRNAFTLPMVDTWAQLLLDAQADPEVRVVVVTGAGPGFCSGIDTAWLDDEQRTPLQRKTDLVDHIHQVPLALEQVDKPVIAAINGVAVGAGLDMALMCDLRLAARSARMAESYVKVGLVPGDGGCWLLPRLIGLPRALELLLTGDDITAEQAERWGMVNHVYDDEQLPAETLALAQRLAAGPPVALRLIKRATVLSQRMDFRASLDLISSHLAVTRSTADSLEAYHAFRERRPATFVGH